MVWDYSLNYFKGRTLRHVTPLKLVFRKAYVLARSVRYTSSRPVESGTTVAHRERRILDRIRQEVLIVRLASP